jgi:uncharacterized protein (TIGR00375 family)
MYVADLHIHSKYSRATSKDMVVESLSEMAKKKGIDLLGTGDILHPGWREELKEKLEEKGDGIYTHGGTDYILTGEISNVYNKNGRLRKVHTVLLFPDFETAEMCAKKLAPYGDLNVDGRPTFGMDVVDTIEILLGVSENIGIIPAHVWTPWFSLFGSNSGFDSVEEAFEHFVPHIVALETGLSSDPPMNWRLSSLDRFVLVSNSDAHSPSRIGREANVFSKPLNYSELIKTLKGKNRSIFLFTIEFFPEEGKYHYDGHRNCGVRLSPKESIANKNICPVCGRKLTVGVLHRVESLADRPEGFVPPNAVPYKHLVPLDEIIAEAYGVKKEAESVRKNYENIISRLGRRELEILLDVPIEDIEKISDSRVAEGVKRVRDGDIEVIPGYDGVYGTVRIFPEKREEPKPQMSLF